MNETLKALQELLDEFNRKPKLNFPRFEIEDMIKAKMKNYKDVPQKRVDRIGYSIFDRKRR